jgi:hypothetical protein
MNNKEKRKFPLRRKGFSPRAGTGDYYQRYNVYQNQRRVIGQKQGVASTTVEENVSQVETCIYSECPKSSPKKIRRDKRDKVPIHNQRNEPEVLKNNEDQENVLYSKENTVKLTTEDSS